MPDASPKVHRNRIFISNEKVKPKKRHVFLLLFASFHFIMMAMGAWHVEPFSPSTILSTSQRIYQAYTGADSGYEFFAPDVGSQLQATFEITDTQGQSKSVAFQHYQTSEADLRIGNIINIFSDQQFDQSLQRSIAASWAGSIFGRYPGAKQVKVKVQEYYLPSMEEFRQGQRPFWQDLYVAKFQKKPQRLSQKSPLQSATK